MAHLRAEKAGINADVQLKLDLMYDEELEMECREWMEIVTGEPFPEVDEKAMAEIARDFPGKEFHVSLKNGIYLCKLIKALNPAAHKLKLIKPKNAFQERDLIQHFLDSCIEYGVSRDNLFETEDLHSAVNMNMVVSSIIALGSTAQRNGYDGPLFGPKYAQRNIRSFDEEKLKEGNKVIGLQMGYNLGASQSGMTPYGQSRQIYDPRAV